NRSRCGRPSRPAPPGSAEPRLTARLPVDVETGPATGPAAGRRFALIRPVSVYHSQSGRLGASRVKVLSLRRIPGESLWGVRRDDQEDDDQEGEQERGRRPVRHRRRDEEAPEDDVPADGPQGDQEGLEERLRPPRPLPCVEAATRRPRRAGG